MGRGMDRRAFQDRPRPPRKRRAIAFPDDPPCTVVEMTQSPHFTRCACITRHGGCVLEKAVGGELFCEYCRGRAQESGFAAQNSEDMANEAIGMAIRDKYLDQSSVKMMRELEFDSVTGAPHVGKGSGVAEVDRQMLAFGLRYVVSFLRPHQAADLWKQISILDLGEGKKLKWHEGEQPKSLKQWWFWSQTQLDLLKRTYEPLVTHNRYGKPEQELVWVNERVSGVGEPACGNALDKLFCDEAAGTYESAGASINFQHESFVAHYDRWLNGGHGDAIATVSQGRKATVVLFSCYSGRAYYFRVETGSCWGMRGEIMKAWWAHKVDADGYPQSSHTGGTATHTPGTCSCRVSINFRGISQKHQAELREGVEG